MDERSIPSTAIYGGNLAHTFEYRTTGVHATPHLHWSFSLQEEATVSCPVLVAEDVVYVSDSAGFFSALDARSGDLLWCFATDWAQDGGKRRPPWDRSLLDRATGVTAFCLAGTLGYVASAYQTLYEVDLSNGQAIRSWDEEALKIDFCSITWLLFYDQLVWFNDRMDGFSRLDPATGSIDPAGSSCGDPIMYRHPGGDSDAIYGFGYELRDLPAPLPSYTVYLAINNLEDSPLWYLHEEDGKKVYDDEEVLFRQNIYDGLYTMMDDTLYAVCGLDSGLADALDEDDIPIDELLALNPFTGAVQWRYSIPTSEDTVDGDPIQLAAASHLIFLVTRQGVEAIDTHAHQQRWTWTSNSDDRHVLVADGLLFVLEKSGQVTALDELTGEQRWSLQTEQPIKLRSWHAGLPSTGWFSTIADATLYPVMDHTLCAFR